MSAGSGQPGETQPRAMSTPAVVWMIVVAVRTRTVTTWHRFVTMLFCPCVEARLSRRLASVPALVLVPDSAEILHVRPPISKSGALCPARPVLARRAVWSGYRTDASTGLRFRLALNQVGQPPVSPSQPEPDQPISNPARGGKAHRPATVAGCVAGARDCPASFGRPAGCGAASLARTDSSVMSQSRPGFSAWSWPAAINWSTLVSCTPSAAAACAVVMVCGRSNTSARNTILRGIGCHIVRDSADVAKYCCVA